MKTQKSSRTRRHYERWILILAIFALSAPARAATLPTGFTETVIASGLSSPNRHAVRARRTSLRLRAGWSAARDQGRRASVARHSSHSTSTPLANAVCSASPSTPHFVTNHVRLRVLHGNDAAVHNRISRFTANGDVAVAGSEVVHPRARQPELRRTTTVERSHFGPDGKLYAAVGENAVGSNAQSMNNLLGKMLRLNNDGTIPTDNPFFSSTPRAEPRDLGARAAQPVHVRVQPRRRQSCSSTTSGRVTWEEINDGIAGANYGWPDTEGTTTDPRFDSPRYAYNHSGGACAITGGAFYAPLTPQFPASYVGDYFFADYCAGWIRKLDPADGNSVVNFRHRDCRSRSI